MASEESAPAGALFEPGRRIRISGKSQKCADGIVLADLAPAGHLYYRCIYHGSQHLTSIANCCDFTETKSRKRIPPAKEKGETKMVPAKPAAELPPAKVTKKHTRAAIKEARDADFKDDLKKTPERKDLAARDGKCRVCRKAAEKCANCHGTGTLKKRDESCAACKGSGAKVFCGRECRESARAA